MCIQLRKGRGACNNIKREIAWKWDSAVTVALQRVYIYITPLGVPDSALHTEHRLGLRIRERSREQYVLIVATFLVTVP